MDTVSKDLTASAAKLRTVEYELERYRGQGLSCVWNVLQQL